MAVRSDNTYVGLIRSGRMTLRTDVRVPTVLLGKFSRVIREDLMNRSRVLSDRLVNKQKIVPLDHCDKLSHHLIVEWDT